MNVVSYKPQKFSFLKVRHNPRNLDEKTLTPRCILITRQCSVQISSRTNQSQVRKGLREIPKMPAVSAQFLRIESKMVRVPQQLLQQQLRFFQVAGASQAFHIPK